MEHFRIFKIRFAAILFLLFISNISKLNAQFIQATVSWAGDSVIYPNTIIVVQVRVKIEVGVNSIALSNLLFNTNGSTSPVTDITNAKLWHTGNIDTFNLSSAVLLETYPSPWATNMYFLGSPVNISGTKYFWLTYDIAPGAVICNYTSAYAVSLNQNGNLVYLTNPFPNGYSVIGDGCLMGINESEDKIPYTIHPNPATDFIQLSGFNSTNKFIEINIHDITGRKISNLYSGSCEFNKDSKQFSIRDLKAGFYFLVVKSEKNSQQLNFLKF